MEAENFVKCLLLMPLHVRLKMASLPVALFKVLPYLRKKETFMSTIIVHFLLAIVKLDPNDNLWLPVFHDYILIQN